MLLLLAACTAQKPDGDTSGTVSGSIAVTPRDIPFDVVFVGDTADAELSVRNASNQDVEVTLTITGPRAPDYSLDTYISSPAPGDASLHTLHFAPTAWGEANVVVVVDDGVSGGHIEVSVVASVQEDADGDGSGSVATGGGDCDDGDPATFPGADDAWYDGADTDCAGNDDYDQDADGVTVDQDCVDTDATIHPGATETWYDGIDQDCAGNDDYDQDADGATVDVDCDDLDPAFHPGADDAWYDGIDHDCAGNDDYDADADGYASDGWGGTDCDDTDPAISPGVAETWYDGIDQDCAGGDDWDQDADGVRVEDDCDDTDAAWGVPTVETLDGVDEDCNGTTDDVRITDVAAGVVQGHVASLALGGQGQLSIDSDVTGDAVADLVTATPESGDGYLWVVDGIGTGTLDSLAVAWAEGENGDYLLTFPASPGGDLTGDGVAELLADANSENGSDYGRAYAWEGGSALAGELGSATYTFSGDQADDLLRAVAVGDINGDGVNDVTAGSPKDDSDSASWTGNLALFDGMELDGAMNLDDAIEIHGSSASDYLGYTVAMGDLTGDGLADVLAGAHGDDDGGTGAGAVYVIAGIATSEYAEDADAAATAKITATAADGLGADPIPVPGDIDGDGSLDLVLGSEDAGAVWVYLSLPAGTVRVADADHTLAGSPFAGAVGAASDLDGDGADEIVVGSDAADGAATNSGMVWVYRWDAAWEADVTEPIASITGAAANDRLGSGVATGADLDGDGLEDLALGATGADEATADGGAVYFVRGW